MNDIPKADGKRGVGRRSIHPGSGRRKASPFPRGRVLRAEEVAAVKALLGDRPRERALLIEYLHLIQDQQGCLPEGHLQALAEELKIPMAEVFEVATFYAHFDVVGAGEERPPAVTVRVCDSLSCALAGAEDCCAPCRARRCRGCAWCARPASARAIRRRRRGGSPPRRSRYAGQDQGPGAARRSTRRDAGLPGLRRLREGGRLRGAALLPVGCAQGGRRDRRAVRWRPARSGRRGISRRAANGDWCAARRVRA